MAIIGSGDIASAIIDQPDKIFFASGVSNSSCTEWKEFQREKNLLLTQNKFSHLVYFSSLCIYYADTSYSRHKKTMERLVKDNFAVTTIIRIGNITWGDNPYTLLNFMRAHPEAERRNEIRYLIDKVEFQHWLKLIPDWTTEMNIPGKMINVKNL